MPAFAVQYVTVQGDHAAHAVYASRTVADAVAEALTARRTADGFGPAEVVEVPGRPGDALATWGSLSDPQGSTDYLVIDPDGVYPWPDKLDADGWRRAGA